MNQSAVELTTEILERFRGALRVAGAPLGDAIEPGLSDAEIDEVGIRLGVPIPRELRTLWSWGQPSATNVAPNAGGWDVNPEFELWPAPHAAKVTELFRSFQPELAAWIAFAGPPQDDCLMVLGDGTAPTSPVLYPSIEDSRSLLAAPSLGALFELWAQQLVGGDYKFVESEWQPLEGPLVFIPTDRASIDWSD